MEEISETKLWVDNTEHLYRRKQYMFCNLFLKHSKGVFEVEKAKKLFSYLTAEANRDYFKSIGEHLPLDDRQRAEKEFVDEFLDVVKDNVETGYLKQDCCRMGRREKIFRETCKEE